MRKEQAIATIQQHWTELRERHHVASLSVFGSVARDEAGPDSDIDVLVTFTRTGVDLFDVVELQGYLEGVLGCKVDLATPRGLRPEMRDHILQEASVSPRDSRERLKDILASIVAIFSYIEGMSEAEFYEDQLRVDAVIRNFEIIGEAAAHVSDDIRSRYPDVPWQTMKSMRNFLAHVYFGVELDVVWNAIHNRLLPLVPQLHAILDDLNK